MRNPNGWRRKNPDTPHQIAARAKYRSPEHRAARKHLALLVAAGRATCWRCGRPISPGTAWHVGHNDAGTTIMGAEHAGENRRVAARKGALIANAKRKAARFTRPVR